jgi:rSAM/selenodomain-associated transferase 1
MNREQLIIFVKAPRRGTVKTRLARAIGQDRALAAYREMTARLLGGLANLPYVELRFTPDDAESEMQPWARTGWRCMRQGNGQLGRRLALAFDEAFSRGARRVVIIGSDCPDVAPSDIQLAWTALKTRDLVIGPALDGGYWLIGLGRQCETLFRGIAWSTGGVLRQTMDRARLAGLKTKLLRRLGDIDTEKDWLEAQRKLTSNPLRKIANSGAGGKPSL